MKTYSHMNLHKSNKKETQVKMKAILNLQLANKIVLILTRLYNNFRCLAILLNFYAGIHFICSLAS